MTTTHTTPNTSHYDLDPEWSEKSIGIPYARADVDDAGYHVVCPGCGATFHGSPRIDDEDYVIEDDYEDAVTKSAARRYAEHFALHWKLEAEALRLLTERRQAEVQDRWTDDEWHVNEPGERGPEPHKAFGIAAPAEVIVEQPTPDALIDRVTVEPTHTGKHAYPENPSTIFDHWKVIVRLDGRMMEVADYSRGPFWQGAPPEAPEVLLALSMDYRCDIDDMDPGIWDGDEDERERIEKELDAHRMGMVHLFGAENIEAVLDRIQERDAE